MLRRIMILVSGTAIENAFWRITIICRRSSLQITCRTIVLSGFEQKTYQYYTATEPPAQGWVYV